MSPRKKKSPSVVPVEEVIWFDASGKFGAKLDTSPVINHTVGLMVFEDDTQVVLAHEVSEADNWLEEELDYTKIPKVLIQKRTKLADVMVIPESDA